MGYQIVYGRSGCKRIRGRGKKNGVWLAALLAGGVLMLGLRYTGIGSALKQWLLPGDPQVTEAALSSLRQSMEEGAGFGPAFTAFCREILHGAQLQ